MTVSTGCYRRAPAARWRPTAQRLHRCSTARASRSPTTRFPRSRRRPPTPACSPPGTAVRRRARDVQCDRQRRHPPRRARRRDRRRQPVGGRSEDYTATATGQNARCNSRKPRPCPDLKNETLAASPAHRRAAHAAAQRHRRRRQPDRVDAVRRHRARPGQRRGRRRRLAHGRRVPRPHVPRPWQGPQAVGVLRPSKTVGWGHSARVRGILRNAAGQRSRAPSFACSCASCAWARGYVDRGAVTTGADGRFTFRIRARLLEALPHRLPRLSGRRRPDRQVRRHLQHQGADHHPRAAPRPLARDACASAAACPAARCHRAE